MTADPRFRVPLMLLTTLLFHTAVLSRIQVGGIMPDLMVLVAVCAGVAAGPLKGAVVGFCAGMAADLFLLTPLGLSALVYSLVGYGVGVAHGGVLRAAWYIPVMTAFVASVGAIVLYGVVAWMLGEPIVPSRVVQVAAVVAVANTVMAPLVLRLVRWSLSTTPSRVIA